MALTIEPPGPAAALTDQLPGLGLAGSPAPEGQKKVMQKPAPDTAHIPLTSPGGIVMKGGYLGRQTRTNNEHF